MSERGAELSTLDLDLLREVDREGNLVRACRRLGIGRDRGIYRLGRLARSIGRPVVVSHRGGRAAGSTTLTADGRRILRDGLPGAPVSGTPARSAFGSTAELRGVWHGRPTPYVEVDSGPRLYVTFRAEEGEPVGLSIPPDSVLLARGRFPTSARNVLSGRVRRVGPAGTARAGGPRGVEVDVGGLRLWAALTDASVHRLRLKPGRPVVVYLKATAVHRR